MVEKLDITISFIIWIVAIIVVIQQQWHGKLPSVGLIFTFIFLLAIQFLFGALVNILPWYSPPDIHYTQLGFRETAIAVIGLATGSIIITPSIIKIFPSPWLKVKLQQPDWGLPEAYIYLGLLFWFVLSPILSNVQALRAIVTSGSLVLLVGLSLVCWRSWILQDRKSLNRWLLIMSCLPVITVFTAGYASGMGLLVFILTFILCFYRPRWKSILAIFLTLFLGFSFFVTYYRDRAEIRSIAWKGGGWEATVQQFRKTASSAEFFNPFNSEHLNKINMRMNENVNLGRAVEYIAQGNIEYGGGETIMSAFTVLIPRFLWPNKPSIFGGVALVAKYTGTEKELKKTSGDTSISAGLVFEFYVNFGRLGVFLGFLIFGIIFRLIDIAASARLLTGNWQGFMFWYLPALGALNSQARVTEMLSSYYTVIVLAFLINRIKIPNFLKGKISKINKLNLYLSAQSNLKNYG